MIEPRSPSHLLIFKLLVSDVAIVHLTMRTSFTFAVAVASMIACSTAAPTVSLPYPFNNASYLTLYFLLQADGMVSRELNVRVSEVEVRYIIYRISFID